MKISTNIYYYILFILTQLMSVRFFFNFNLTKNYPLISFTLYLILSFIFFWVIVHYKLIDKITENKYLFYLILITFTIYIFYKYPLSVGTERDDCYKILLNNLSNFNYPYSKTSLGDPCSTGLSALIFYFPVLFYENFFSFVTSIYFLLFYLFFKKYFKISILIFLIYLQIFNLLYLEEAIAGSDFFLISISYVIGILYLNHYFQENKKSHFLIAFLMLYFFYGSRIAFIFLIPINYFLFLNIYNSKKVNKFFIFQFIFSLLTILIPFLLNPSEYHPLHLLTKGYGTIGLSYIIFIILIFLVTFLTIIFLFLKSDFYKNYILKIIKRDSINLHLMIYTTPLILVIIKTFINRINTNLLSNWEGLSYLILIFPSLIFILSSYLKNYDIYKKIKKN